MLTRQKQVGIEREWQRTFPHRLAAGLCCLLLSFGLGQGAQSPALDLQEVLQVIRTNLPDLSEADLNRAMANGLVGSLRPRVIVAETESAPLAPSPSNLVTRAAVYDREIGYLRVGTVAEGLALRLGEEWTGLTATNRALRGFVLDLRFAGGTDYRAAADAADRFLSASVPVLDWGEGTARSTAKTNAWNQPMVVLVNQATESAAEALAGILRAADRVVILGAQTAGRAWIYREVPLSSGQKLRLAVSPIRVGDSEALVGGGLTPDVAVAVPELEEREYFENAFHTTRDATSRIVASAPPRRRVNEAVLVRRRQEGADPLRNPDSDGAPARLVPVASVQDPVLARGLDLLNGIALFGRPEAR